MKELYSARLSKERSQEFGIDINSPDFWDAYNLYKLAYPEETSCVEKDISTVISRMVDFLEYRREYESAKEPADKAKVRIMYAASKLEW